MESPQTAWTTTGWLMWLFIRWDEDEYVPRKVLSLPANGLKGQCVIFVLVPVFFFRFVKALLLLPINTYNTLVWWQYNKRSVVFPQLEQFSYENLHLSRTLPGLPVSCHLVQPYFYGNLVWPIQLSLAFSDWLTDDWWMTDFFFFFKCIIIIISPTKNKSFSIQ